MKIIPLILICIFLIPIAHPCIGNDWCHDEETELSSSCGTDDVKHGCCAIPDNEDRAPLQNNSPGDHCACFCCFHVMAPTYAVIDFSEIPGIKDEKSWLSEIYFHDFTHLIWHPPKKA